MNLYKLTLAKLTPGLEQLPQDEEHEGCYNEFVRCLRRRLPVNYWRREDNYLSLIYLLSIIL
jgi:hypothetical protein